MKKSKILLQIEELHQIIQTLKQFPEADYIEISVENIDGLGKITELSIPDQIQDIIGMFNITITDENKW